MKKSPLACRKQEPIVRREAIARIQAMTAEHVWLVAHILALNQARNEATKRLDLLCYQIEAERESIPPNAAGERIGGQKET